MADTIRRPVSLLDELQAGAGFEAGLLTSFNSYLPFVEEVVFPRLRATGCHYLVAMSDRAQLASELAEKTRRPQTAGRRYALLPIGCGGAFHPKILLLVGPKRARLFIGSHNLTMSGFIQNRELTNIIEITGPKDREGAAALIEAIEFCKAWAVDLPLALRTVIEDFGKLCAAYAGPVPERISTTVVGARPTGPSLWQRVRSLLPESAKRIVVLGPYFDQGLSFLKRLQDDLGPRSLVVGLDPKSAHFPGDMKALPSGLRVVDAHDLSPGHKGRGFLHGKAILIEGKSERILITGSANPTARAWLAPAGSRNAEIVVVRRLPASHPDDLGLVQLCDQDPLEERVLSKLRARPEPKGEPADSSGLLVGVCQESTIHIEGTFRASSAVVVRDSRGAELKSRTRKTPGGMVVDVEERAHDASSLEATVDGQIRYGFVHHPELLREAALSSSQRRVREALSGLSGDASQLEGLLRLVEKVIFEAPAVRVVAGRSKEESKEPKGGRKEGPTVVLVETLKAGQIHDRRHLAEGDLGLLLDFLLRKLWQNLAHEPSAGGRSEVELVDSENEDFAEQLPSDRTIAEAWHRKSRTLLKRLRRRIEEGSEALPVVIEAAAVLGVLEAVRRVEDQDRWRSVRAEFVDREAAEEFVLAATPRLLTAATGLVDRSTVEAGAPFAEQQGLIEWMTWLAWLTGFGPTDLTLEEDPEEPESASVEADRLACACIIGAHASRCNQARLLEFLEAAPFPGTDARGWLDALLQLGATFANPLAARKLDRPPRLGDLVLTLAGAGPFVVRSVRAGKVDLIDFGRENGVATFLSSSVRVLDAEVSRQRHAAG